MNGKHLTKDDRLKLETLLIARVPKTQIAKQLHCSRNTVYNEIKRGLYDRNVDWEIKPFYSADIGQMVHDKNATAKGSPLKIGNDWDFVNYVEDKIINKKFSPAAVIAQMKLDGLYFKGAVCARTLYNYIDSGDIFPNITRESLIMKGQRKKKYDRVKPVRKKKILARSIDERPIEILERQDSGHWEMDTVVGGRNGNSVSLLVLTERKTRAEIIRKLPDRTTESVIAEIDKLELRYGTYFSNYFKSITVDNGSEFMDNIGLERSLNGGVRTIVYYCNPYSSFERGSNENANKLIRRFVPKGSDISKLSNEYIQYIQDWINRYPRRILGYSTSRANIMRELGVLI